MAILMKLTMLELHVTDLSTLGLLYLDDKPLCNFKLHGGSLDETEYHPVIQSSGGPHVKLSKRLPELHRGSIMLDKFTIIPADMVPTFPALQIGEWSNLRDTRLFPSAKFYVNLYDRIIGATYDKAVTVQYFRPQLLT